jgi:hypothetical protein
VDKIPGHLQLADPTHAVNDDGAFEIAEVRTHKSKNCFPRSLLFRD